MVYLINAHGRLETYFTKEMLYKSGHSESEAFCVENSDYNGKAYIQDAKIFLGEPKSVVYAREIRDLKQFLNETDYITNKIVEGDATIEDYADTIEKRKKARRRIDELQKII